MPPVGVLAIVRAISRAFGIPNFMSFGTWFFTLLHGEAVGTDEFDLVTHGLKHRAMAFYQVRKGAPVKLATSDVYGRGGVKILV